MKSEHFRRIQQGIDPSAFGLIILSDTRSYRLYQPVAVIGAVPIDIGIASITLQFMETGERHVIRIAWAYAVIGRAVIQAQVSAVRRDPYPSVIPGCTAQETS